MLDDELSRGFLMMSEPFLAFPVVTHVRKDSLGPAGLWKALRFALLSSAKNLFHPLH